MFNLLPLLVVFIMKNYLQYNYLCIQEYNILFFAMRWNVRAHVRVASGGSTCGGGCSMRRDIDSWKQLVDKDYWIGIAKSLMDNNNYQIFL